jgi:hypothetical protein
MSKIKVTQLNGKPSVKILKNRIKNIDSSYNNPWDILAELTQNSVDAIKQRSDVETGKIEIFIDARNKAIEITDNGIGIKSDEIQELLSLDGTNKRDDDKTIGEKGVGLKFVIFQCNDFVLKSYNPNSTPVKVTLENAYNWKIGKVQDEIEFDIDKEQGNDVIGTNIRISEVENFDIFDLNIKQIEFVLRTKTAIGNVLKKLGKDDKDVKITLKYRAKSSNDFEEKEISYKFLAIDENLQQYEILNAEHCLTFIEQYKDYPNKIVAEFKGKIFELTQEFDTNGRRIVIKYWYLSSNKNFEEINLKYNGIITELFDREKFDYIGFQKGITTSVKGMPTGIYLKEPQTGAAGYWPRFFIIIEDPKQKFDIGRKTIDESIHGKTKTMYLDKIREAYNKYFLHITRYIPSDTSTNLAEPDPVEVWESINRKTDLGVADIKFRKIPDDQEAGVFALFFECLGKDIIKEIEPFYCSYKNQYDLYVKIKGERKIIEFKSKISKLIKDLIDLTKLFKHINCLVCWDVDNKDIEKFKNNGVDLSPVYKSSFAEEDFPNATHRLTRMGSDPIYVIDLKVVLENYKKSLT